MIVAIYMPLKDAILLADTDREGSIELPIAEARAIADTIARADHSAELARDLAEPRP